MSVQHNPELNVTCMNAFWCVNTLVFTARIVLCHLKIVAQCRPSHVSEKQLTSFVLKDMVKIV